MLADAAGEDDRVGAVQDGEVGAEILARPVTEDVERQAGPGIAALAAASRSRTSALRPPGRAGRSPVEPVLDLLERHALACAPARRASDGSISPERVPITSPSSGVRPIEVSTDAPPSDGRRRAAAAEVEHDQLRSETGRFSSVAVRGRGPRVGDAVEAVAADAVALGQLLRHRVRAARSGSPA